MTPCFREHPTAHFDRNRSALACAEYYQARVGAQKALDWFSSLMTELNRTLSARPVSSTVVLPETEKGIHLQLPTVSG